MPSFTATNSGSPLFIDTWGWLVLAESSNRAAFAEQDARRSPGSQITTDYVLDETITRLFARARLAVAQTFCDAIFATEAAGLLRIERITAERFSAAYKLRRRYRDKPKISFTDLTSFVVIRELGVRDVLTVDRHFSQAGLGLRLVPK
jgi:predicted nucleic acid-binding protein